VGAVTILFLFVVMLLNLREFKKIFLNKLNFFFFSCF
jgi:NADH:ubiquinone oxidoreductase subunit 6 (subunit J)